MAPAISHAIIHGMSRWFRSYGFADVSGDLLVGAYPLDEGDVATLGHAGVQKILNLTEEEEYRPGDRQAVVDALAAAGIEERRLPLTDYGGLPPEALDAAVDQVNEWLDAGARTYVHCRAGWQRSAAVAAAVVAVRTGIDIDEALYHVRLRKPSADPLPHQREDLRRWWAARDGRG
jgi:protein-tyrosine phosphatase